MLNKILIYNYEVISGIIFSMLNQDFIPKDVIDNWKRPKYNRGRGNNFDYEISLFIRELIERGIIKNA